MAGFWIVVFLVAGWYVWKKVQEHDEIWQHAASRLNLRKSGEVFTPNRLAGKFDGFKVIVDTQTAMRSSQGAPTTVTRYRVFYPSLKLGLKLTRDRGGLRRKKAQDIEVGDKPFDKWLIVQGRSPQNVTRFLTPERRYRIMRTFKAFRSCQITDTEIRCATHSSDSTPGRIESRVKSLVGLAKALTTGAPKLEPALVARRRGDYDRARRVLPKENDADANVVEAEILHVSRRRVEARELLAKVKEERPDDEQLVEMETAPDPPEPQARATEEDKDAVAACQALFGGGLSSVDVERLFAESYDGRRVRWTGTLEDATEYTSDFVFGREPGTRAVVKLHEIEQGYFGIFEIRAVLQMPPGNEQALGKWRDQPITFTGTLMRVDPFVRNLFVVDATVG